MVYIAVGNVDRIFKTILRCRNEDQTDVLYMMNIPFWSSATYGPSTIYLLQYPWMPYEFQPVLYLLCMLWYISKVIHVCQSHTVTQYLWLYMNSPQTSFTAFLKVLWAKAFPQISFAYLYITSCSEDKARPPNPVQQYNIVVHRHCWSILI